MLNAKSKSNVLIRMVDAAALLLVIQTMNSACMWLFHQPEIPRGALKYRKIR